MSSFDVGASLNAAYNNVVGGTYKCFTEESKGACGYAKALTDKVTTAYAGFVDTADKCFNEGTYGVDGDKPIPNAYCAQAKAAKTTVLDLAGRGINGLKSMFSGKIFGIEVTAKGVGYAVAAVAASVVAVRAVQSLMSPAKKKIEQGYALKF